MSSPLALTPASHGSECADSGWYGSVQSSLSPVSNALHGMVDVHHEDSVVVARGSDELYDMVADVTRMGEWSPVCKACWWDEGSGPSVGGWFTGRNELPERTWETRSEVVVADRGREFAFVVSATSTRWGYLFSDVDGGTRITESWDFPPSAVAVFEDRFGDDAEAQIASRAELARAGIPKTLAAIKRAGENG